MKPISNAEIKNHIYVMLRQADLDVYPEKFPMNVWLQQRADETRVQAIYQKVKAELNRAFESATQPTGRRTSSQRRAEAEQQISKWGTSSQQWKSSSKLPDGSFGKGGLK